MLRSLGYPELEEEIITHIINKFTRADRVSKMKCDEKLAEFEEHWCASFADPGTEVAGEQRQARHRQHLLHLRRWSVDGSRVLCATHLHGGLFPFF